MYGLMIYDVDGHEQSDVSFGNKAEIIETRILNRIQPLHFGVNYHAEPLTFKLVFGREEPMDRYDLEKISYWLTGHRDYQWLEICQADLSHVRFRCLFTELTPISVGWLPVAFEATVTCDCPYAYSLPFAATYTGVNNSGRTYTFSNRGSVREYLKPDLLITKSAGTTVVSIVNLDDNNREFKLSDLPSSALTITVRNNSGIITSSPAIVDLYRGFNHNFFRLVPGDNRLVITGGGQYTMTGRFLHNVGA